MKCDIGVFGLGVMGASLGRNMIRRGFSVSLYSISPDERKNFSDSSGRGQYTVCDSLQEFINSLEAPRKVFLMITAGAPVDQVIRDLMPYLEEGDVIIDGGNSYYEDTQRRCRTCHEAGIHYVGAGVSGGEKGALEGPSIMAGGSAEGYEQSKHILETIAAHNNGRPCCCYIGPGGSGHYVKMVHNGIEYAILELIGETYMLLKYGLGRQHEEIQEIFRSWRSTRLDSYLLDISVRVMEEYEEDKTPLVDRILDTAEQKGTGLWTVEEALRRGVYMPAVYEAVAARSFSGKKALRMRGAEILPFRKQKAVCREEKNLDEETIERALELAVLLSYSQGYELIAKASEDNNWGIDLSVLADVWSDGCIIRGEILKEIKAAGPGKGKEPLFMEETFQDVWNYEEALRKTVCFSETAGIASVGYAASLHEYDYYRTADMPVRIIQALRDCFGAHTYMRTDRPGHFHTDWEKEK